MASLSIKESTYSFLKHIIFGFTKGESITFELIDYRFRLRYNLILSEKSFTTETILSFESKFSSLTESKVQNIFFTLLVII